MNEQSRQFAINWLKSRGFFNKGSISKGLDGEFALELVETFLDQDHDDESFEYVPKLFLLIYEEMIKNNYSY